MEEGQGAGPDRVVSRREVQEEGRWGRPCGLPCYQSVERCLD